MSEDRISLTPLTVADADEMVDVLSGERLYTFTGGSAPTLEGLRARYTRQVTGRSPDGLEEWRNWIVRRGHDGQAVGYVQATITEQGRKAEIAWVIGLAWQRRGYASQAATALVAWLFDRGSSRSWPTSIPTTPPPPPSPPRPGSHPPTSSTTASGCGGRSAPSRRTGRRRACRPRGRSSAPRGS
ncbi:GNAT family N-acetyltransferase [Nonomuraea recticatena]|uniref:GNAT family N-acetyltransferase n=1 Tax=Nonomuraea recticatena TaxID=46178 RepID=UPI00361B5E97